MARVADDLVRRILFDGRAGLRLLNESAVQVDVWIAFAGKPAEPVDLLLTPLDTTPAATLARVLHKALDGVPTKVPRHIAPLEATVAIRLGFEEFVSEVLPCTGLDLDAAFDDLRTLMLARRGGDMVAPLTARDLAAFIDVSRGRLSPEVRAALLVTLLLLARKLDAGLLIASNDQSSMPVMAGTAGDMPLPLERDLRPPLARVDPLIWRVALNRQVVPLSLSVSTIKADAAQRVFDIDCRNLTWAVIDSGIDGSHPAFRDHAAGNFATRVDNAYDFARMRALASFDTLADAGQRRGHSRRDPGQAADRRQTRRPPCSPGCRPMREAGRPYDWRCALQAAGGGDRPARRRSPATSRTAMAPMSPACWPGDWREDSGERVSAASAPICALLDLRVLGDTARPIPSSRSSRRWNSCAG